jgi:hypothetical protein
MRRRARYNRTESYNASVKMEMLLVHSPPGISTSVNARFKEKTREIARADVLVFDAHTEHKAPSQMSWRAKRHARANARRAAEQESQCARSSRVP